MTCNKNRHDTTINAPLINGNSNNNNDKIAMRNSKFIVETVKEDKPQEKVESAKFSEEICRSMVKMLDSNQSGKLGLEEFKKLMYEIAKWKVIWIYFLILEHQRFSSFEQSVCSVGAEWDLMYLVL